MFFLLLLLQGKTTIIPDSYYTYWPNSVIYYEIHSSLCKRYTSFQLNQKVPMDHSIYDCIASDRGAIEDAMNEYATRTCLRFEDRAGNSNIDNYILIRGDKSG